MSEIKAIIASWDCKTEKSDTFRLLNMIHSMAGYIAQISREWTLGATCTDSNYVLTEWTNGIVDILAETYKDYDGSPNCHVYTLKKARGETE